MATKYFQGATNSNYSVAGNWSTTTPAFTGTTTPTNADIATFNSASPSCIVDTPSNCQSLTCTGYTNTLTFNSSLTIGTGGSITLASGMTLAGSPGVGSLALSGSSTPSITTAGKTIPFDFSFGAGNPTITLNDALVILGTLTIPTGTHTMSGAFNITCGTLAITGGPTLWKLVSGTTTTITTALDTSGVTSNGFLLSAVTASSTAYMILRSPATQTLNPFLTVTDIDSSGGATIFTLPGTLTRTVNWNNNPGTVARVAGGFVG